MTASTAHWLLSPELINELRNFAEWTGTNRSSTKRFSKTATNLGRSEGLIRRMPWRCNERVDFIKANQLKQSKTVRNIVAVCRAVPSRRPYLFGTNAPLP